MSKTASKPGEHSFSADKLFSGGGEMGALMRAKDWSRTPLGPPGNWPESLRTAVRIILPSRYPMFVWWGKDLINLYNDQYRPFLGKKHPASLGTSGRVVWSEIWDQIGPRADAVLLRGEATFDERLLLMMDRHGYLEETYFTFSYSPLPGDDLKTAGLFCVVTEETERVISERRMTLLRKIASSIVDAKTAKAVCDRTAACLIEANKDLPFSLIYLRDEESRTLRLACAAGIDSSHPAAPATIEPGSTQVWPAAEVLSTGSIMLVGDLSSRFPNLPTGFWSQPPGSALLVPLAQQGQTKAPGVLITGINPHRKADEEFTGFVGLVAGQIAAGIANAHGYEAERKRAEALAELDRAKTAFFSNVSHEFRTPLTLMLGPTEDALASRSRALRGADLERVHRNELRLLNLVNTLLDFSRLETGRMKAKYQATDLRALTSDLASVFRSAMERAGLSFRVKCLPLSQPVHIDRDMWEKIVLNLLSNALKSTFDGSITVTLRDAKDHAELSVTDTGTGIPEKEIPHLFERFRRIENARRRTHEGSGIGLALVHESVQMHGGKIEVKSVVDKGSTFTISIPFGTSHLPAEAVRRSEEKTAPSIARNAFVQEALSWLPGETDASQEIGPASAAGLDAIELPPEAAAGDAAATGRVLLVDDNRDMREYVEKLLHGRFEVTTAENGRVALEKALAHPPDIVLSDVMMPEMDGFQLLKALREQTATSMVPVILLSARAGEEAQIGGMEAGADDYLTKPFSARELLARVQAHLKIARFRKEALQHELQLERELQEVRRMAAETAENISDALIAIDSEWRFTYLNPRAEKMAREAGARGELTGSVFWDVFPQLRATEIEHQYRRCMELRIPAQFEAPLEQRWYGIRVYPAPDGIIVYAADVTNRKSAEIALRMKQEHLLLTQKAAKIGTWELDTESEYLTVSPEFAEIMGRSAQASRLRYSDFLDSLFLSSDREKTEEALQQSLRKNKEFITEVRLKRPDGSVRLVSNRGKVFYNQGKPVVLGALVDIGTPESQSATKPVSSRKAGKKTTKPPARRRSKSYR